MDTNDREWQTSDLMLVCFGGGVTANAQISCSGCRCHIGSWSRIAERYNMMRNGVLATTSTITSMGRGKSYGMEANSIFPRAWISVSEGTVVVIDQYSKTFFETFHRQFNENGLYLKDRPTGHMGLARWLATANISRVCTLTRRSSQSLLENGWVECGWCKEDSISHMVFPSTAGRIP